MRVLLADDQDMVRSALRLVIDQEQDFKVIGEVIDPDQMFDTINRCRPDLLLLDWELLPSDRKAYLKSLKHEFPHLFVIAMSACLLIRQEAMLAGAHAFMSKVDPTEDFISYLRDLSDPKKFDFNPTRHDYQSECNGTSK